ncbi:hypothetical protein AB4Z34_13375 [Ensifer sp. 2YAB10]|uniref:hypothetical protein n=1 Tax=unclassified Ensifer TaxID=2633371 RepID=UPI000DE2C1A2|nr:hypothetical protein [Ensifer sp. SSB1]MBK5568206.1 hypothetical protein [Ensifer sp. SSB1]
MKAAKTKEIAKPTNLVEQYRPLGLKAVLAAALQAKGKPATKMTKRPALTPGSFLQNSDI